MNNHFFFTFLSRYVPACIAALTLVLSACATTSPDIDSILPPGNNGRMLDTQVRSGIESLLNGNYQNASQAFNAILRVDPQNSYVQFLNGLAYHLMAEAGDSSRYEYAQIGYELALKFDANNYLAAQQLARLFLKKKKYAEAQEYFARVLLYKPDDAEMLYGLAQSSYHAYDLATAVGAIKRARELKPDAPEIVGAYSLMMAAAGQPDEANRQLTVYREIEPSKPRYEHLIQRVADWRTFHQMKKSGDSPAAEEKKSEPHAPARAGEPADWSAEKKPRMVVVDVILIRTEEIETTNKGVNLLEGLSLQFEGSNSRNKLRSQGLSFSDVSSSPSGNNTNESVVTSSLSIPKVTYNLNIFNVGNDHSEILARPTLVALEGQPSVFFSGSQLNVAVSGLQSGSLEKMDVGVRLEVTPRFISDDTVVLNVTAGRSFMETGLVGNFSESVRTSKNEVTANAVLKFGQTLILAGLREKQTAEVKTGVPLLRDIPIIQYFFSNEKTMDFHKSILTILTPRKVSPGIYTTPPAAEPGGADPAGTGEQHGLKELKESYSRIFAADDNLHHVMRHLNKHPVYREFRETDFYDKPWYGRPDSLSTILEKAAGFLYY